MKKIQKIAIMVLSAAFTVSGWLLPACSKKNDLFDEPNDFIEQTTGNAGEDTENNGNGNENNEGNAGENGGNGSSLLNTQPKADKAEYIKVTADGVNIRSGAGAGFSSLGVAEKNTLYALCGLSGGWYKTYYKNKTAYISAKYCTTVQMDKSSSAQVEKVIEEGYKCLGVTYVYGATRYHDGNGNKLSGFTISAFDCSSLMQYLFKIGANVNLQVNTRTQVYQGTTVKMSALKRGDLIFFTNASRKNNTGVERVGHVAMYLGDNYILHTASDYAKIEQISSTRWGYYIQTQRMI